MYVIKARARLLAKDLSELSDSSLRRIAKDSSDSRSHQAKQELKKRSKSSLKEKTEIFKNVGLGLGGLGAAGAYGYIGHETGKAADKVADAADNARRMISDENKRQQLMHNHELNPKTDGYQYDISTDDLDAYQSDSSILDSLSDSAATAWDSLKTTISDNSDLLTDLL